MASVLTNWKFDFSPDTNDILGNWVVDVAFEWSSGLGMSRGDEIWELDRDDDNSTRRTLNLP